MGKAIGSLREQEVMLFHGCAEFLNIQGVRRFRNIFHGTVLQDDIDLIAAGIIGIIDDAAGLQKIVHIPLID